MCPSNNNELTVAVSEVQAQSKAGDWCPGPCSDHDLRFHGASDWGHLFSPCQAELPPLGVQGFGETIAG